MAFDDIPEDAKQSFPCEYCPSGSVSMVKRGDDPYEVWCCDTCNFEARPASEEEYYCE